MNNRKTPIIRFKGFTDDWEQRKLGEIGKARSGVGFPDAEQGGRTGIPFFKVSDMNLDVNENEMTISNNYVTAEQIANHRWSPITEVPAIFFAKVGAAVLLNRKRLCRFPFLLDNNTMSYSLSPTKWDADFAKALFGTVDLTSLVQVGALPSYNAGDVESMEKYLPSLLEQEQIGVFFKHLDHLITLHQRKLEKLKIVKKAMLENCFPKNGEKVPKFRFSGFTGDWEQRKFEEVFIERREKTEQENEDTLLSCTINGMFLNSELFGHFRGTTTIGYLRVKKNDLILSAQNLHLGNANVNLRFEHGIISPAYKVYDLNSCDPEFVQAWVKKDNTKNFFLAATTEGASQCRKNIEWETLGKQTISMPSMDEQRQIGVYFRRLDHLITLHQRKLEKLKIIKKSFLEKMFV